MMRVVSLFSGIGGLDKGFSDAGYDVVWANDFDQYAVQTYNANFNTKATLAAFSSPTLPSLSIVNVPFNGSLTKCST